MSQAACPPPAPIELDVAEFRLMFPAFADTEKWPDVMIRVQFDAACDYVSPYPGRRFGKRSRKRLLYLMTAHLLHLNSAQAESGQPGQGGMVSSATVDKISVTLATPQVKSQWQWWMGL